MPGEETELRVFEPRYKQMLDDCLLDNKNFGLVMSDSFEQINGWDKPRMFGCEAEILEHDTKGSNHFLKIVGRRKFEITNLFKPALPPFSDEMFDQSTVQMGIYPDMETLYDMIPEDSESTKLYISAEVEYLPKFEQIDQSTRVSSSMLNIKPIFFITIWIISFKEKNWSIWKRKTLGAWRKSYKIRTFSSKDVYSWEPI